MKITFGTNIKFTISDESAGKGITVTIAGLPAGVDLEKEDFMRNPGSEEPQFGEGRLLCKDGSFVTDGRPFDIIFASGSLENALVAAGVLARHIIAPIRVVSISGSAGECLCSCMPAGLQLARAAISINGVGNSILPDAGLEGGLTTGEELRWRVTLSGNGAFAQNASLLAETLAALSLADSLFF